MKKFYAALFIVLPFTTLKSQCPIINGALVNACGTEGINEFVVFTTTGQAAASAYTLYYASTTPPKTTPTNVLAGSTASAKNGSGTIITGGGACTITYVTNPASILPAGATVVLMPSNFDNSYNVAPLCTGGTVYIILADITKSPNVWNSGGTLSNSPASGTSRYLQITNGASDCTTGIRAYSNEWGALGVSGDGAFVTWDAITGNPTYSNGGCDLVTPLPVNLISFTAFAEGKNARVEWASASELSTKSFELERSLDAKSFARVYSTPAAGNSSAVKTYAYTDMDIPAGVNYYRLKMIDINGSFEYSKVAKVISNRSGFTITNMYPTPASSQLNVSYNANAAGTTTATIVDIAGRQLSSLKLSTNKGMNYQAISVSTLPTGSYLLKLENNGKTVSGKFSKQ